MCGPDSWVNCVNWNPLSAIWKCEFSSSSSSSERSESDSCSWCRCVKAFLIFLKFLVSFVTPFAWLDRDELYESLTSFYVSGKLVYGCPFLLKLKHFLSFHYSLSKGVFTLMPLLTPPLPPLCPPTPCTNAVPLECVVLCITFLMYLLSRCRVCWRFLGHRLSPVVK